MFGSCYNKFVGLSYFLNFCCGTPQLFKTVKGISTDHNDASIKFLLYFFYILKECSYYLSYLNSFKLQTLKLQNETKGNGNVHEK